ncbi:hypothetical protein J1614_011311 [Plenodomus biglobosus]|nr:hypothetical protein J1614_011311 [Plenodomus biglobosus]
MHTMDTEHIYTSPQACVNESNLQALVTAADGLDQGLQSAAIPVGDVVRTQNAQWQSISVLLQSGQSHRASDGISGQRPSV